MNTTELSAHLRDATDGLTARPDFADAVLRGGRRRRARRRLTVVASVLAVAPVAATATVVTRRADDPAPVADARLTQPTKGDLAGDRAFLDEVSEVWRRDLPIVPEARDRYYDDPRGAPHVYWAGDTPAGRAAIVLQQVYVHPNSQVVVTGLRTAEGLVAIDPVDGQLKVVGTRPIGWDAPNQADFYMFGPKDRTMLAVDHGKPIHYSFNVEITTQDNGRWTGRAEWRRAEPEDGVAFATASADDQTRTALGYEGDDPPEVLRAENAPFARSVASYYLNMRLPDASFRVADTLLDWGDSMWTVGDTGRLTPTALNWRSRSSRYYVGDPEVVDGLWTIAAVLPDGRLFILKEQQTGWSAPRLIARVAPSVDRATTELVDGGLVDKDAVLPVRFKIPDGGGWIVADKGKELSYRTAPDAPWQKAGRDAALLPADATEVLAGDHFVRL